MANQKIQTPGKAPRSKYVINETTPFIITEAYKMARTNLIFSLSTFEIADNIFEASTALSITKAKSLVNGIKFDIFNNL